MTEPNPLELLDLILATLNTIALADEIAANKRPHHFDLLRIIESNNYKVDKTDFNLALEKLVDDGYIKNIAGHESSIDNPYEERDYPSYSITFKGRIFCLQKGYEQQEINATALSSQIRDTKSFQIGQATRLNNLTRWLAIGAVGLLLWEIVKYFVFEHPLWH